MLAGDCRCCWNIVDVAETLHTSPQHPGNLDGTPSANAERKKSRMTEIFAYCGNAAMQNPIAGIFTEEMSRDRRWSDDTKRNPDCASSVSHNRKIFPATV